ncbi:Matrixin [Secundilactobacillus kimchicus JCM 15530]|uniref:Matrixin n=1 Tax=Secundilactobacillus kimchicus JCM 15530 TaxID=1302272 RepID=A0A0R1HLY5_9LACO|nr:Matrixin [Secundilactobacillus kimchicus JCM 15530]
MKKVLASVSLLSTVALTPLAASAAATPQLVSSDGYPVRYQNAKASFYNKSASEGYANVWRAARDNWNSTGAFTWTETSNVDSRTFTSSVSRNDGDWYNATGLTYSRVQIDANNPAWQTGASIYLNRYYLDLDNYTTAEKETVATHEMGHGLGLDHNPETNSIMYYAARDQSISNDDIQGAVNIYSSARVLNSDETEPESVANDTAGMHLEYRKDYTGQSGLAQLKNDSEMTVVGTIKSAKETDDFSEDTPSHYTTHKLAISETLKGTALESVDFIQAGTSKVVNSDTKALKDGDRVLVTLQKDDSGNWHAVNNGQGLFIGDSSKARSAETFSRASDGSTVTADMFK